MKKRGFLLLSLAIFGMTISACSINMPTPVIPGQPIPVPTPSQTVPVESISLDQTTLTFTVGESAKQLSVVFNPTNATDKSVTWTSSDSSVATVNANGLVTPVKVGNTVIIAMASGKTAFCNVAVNPVAQFTVSLNSNVGEGSQTLVAAVVNANTQYTLPENSFAAPEGQQFAGWLVGESVKQPGESITVSEDIVIKATWESTKTLAELYRLAYGADDAPTWAWANALVGEMAGSDDINVKSQVKFDFTTDVATNFKIRGQGDEWYGTKFLEGDGQSEEDNNIALSAGAYDIYFKLYKDGGHSIAVVKENEPQLEGYVLIGIQRYELTINEGQTQFTELWSEELNLKAGDELTFYVNGNKINNCVPDPLEGDTKNNVRLDDGHLTVIQDAQGRIYLQLLANNVYQCWVDGGPARTLADLYRLAYGAENAETWGWEHALVGEMVVSDEVNVKAQVKFVLETATATNFKIRGEEAGENTKWFGTKYVEGFVGEEDNNIPLEAGTYHVYFKEYNDGKLTIYYAKQEGPQPVEDVYKAFLGETEITLTDVTEETIDEQSGWVKQFKGVVTVAKDDVLTFKKNNEAYFPGAGNDEDNNVSYDNETKLLTVLCAKEDAELYLKIYEDGGADVYLSGYKAPVVGAWEAIINGQKVATQPNPENDNEVQLLDVQLEVNDTIYFSNATANLGYSNLKDSVPPEHINDGFANFEAGQNDELKATVAGTYTFYVDFVNSKIWVIKEGVEPEPKTLAELYRLAYGPEEAETWGWEHALVGEMADSDDVNVKAQVKFELTLQATTGFKIRGEEAGQNTKWFGTKYLEGEGQDDDNLNITLGAGEYHIYFKEYNDGGFSIAVVKQGQPVVGAWEAIINGQKVATEENPGNPNEVQLLNVELKVDDIICFSNTAVEMGYSDLKESDPPEHINDGFANFEATQLDEMKATSAGTYSFYVDIANYKIWVVKAEEPAPEVTYYVQVGEEKIELVVNEDQTSFVELMTEEEIELKEGDELVFYADDEVLTVVPDTSEWIYKNNVELDDGHLLVVQDAEASIFLQLIDENTIQCWVGGGRVRTLAEQYRLAYGEDSEDPTWLWENAVEGVMVDSEDENVSAQVKFSIETGEEIGFKIRSEEAGEMTQWYGAKYLEGQGQDDNDGNIPLQAGSYDIYFKLYKNGGHSIAIVDNGEAPVVIPAHTIHLGSGEEWSDIPLELNEDYYAKLNLELEEGDLLKIKMSEDDSDWRGFAQVNKTEFVNTHFESDGTNDDNIRVKVAGTYDIYVLITPENGISIAIVAQGEDPMPEPEEHTYSVIGSFGEDPWGEDVNMIIDGDGLAILEDYHFDADDEIMIRQDGKWSQEGGAEWGYTSVAYATDDVITNEGGNIKFLVSGTYNIMFDPETGEIAILLIDADPEPSIEDWKAVIDGIDTPVEANPNDEKEIQLVEVDLDADSLVTFTNGTVVLGYDDLKASEEPLHINDGFENFIAGQNGELKVKVAGTYSFYVNIETGKIWIVKEGQEPEPEEHTYGVAGTFSQQAWGEDLNMEVNEGVATLTGQHFDVNTEIKVRLDGAWIFSWGYADLDEEHSTMLVLANDGGNIKLLVAGTYTVSFDLESKKVTVVLTEADPAQQNIHLNRNEEWSDIPLELKQEGEYMKLGVELQVGDIFRIQMAAQDMRGFDSVNQTAFVLEHFESNGTNDDNIRVKVAGTFDIYAKVTPENGISIWIVEHAVVVPWVVLINGVEIPTIANPNNQNEVMLENLELKAGDIIVLKHGDAEFGFAALKSGEGNANAHFSEGQDGELVVVDAGLYSFYFDIVTEEAGKIWTARHDYSLIGTYDSHSFDNDDAMPVENGVATIVIDLEENDEFKVRMDASWDNGKVWGYADLTDASKANAKDPTQDGNIVIAESGKYIISFDINTKKITITKVVATEITIKTPATKTEYYVGDTLDVTGLVVTITYNDSSTRDVQVLANMVDGFNSAAATAKQTLTISCEGLHISYDISIEEVVAEEIAIKTPASKTSYFVGEALDVTNLVVTITFNNGETEDVPVTAQMVSGFNSSAPAAKQTLTIESNDLSITYDVEIIAIAVTGISIETPASKLEYMTDEELDVTGLTIRVNYNNGTHEIIPVTAQMVSNFDSSNVANPLTLTITHEGQTAQYNVSIWEVLSITLGTAPTKTEYEIGEQLDLTGIVVIACCNAMHITNITDPSAFQVSGFDSSSAGQKTITVTYKTKTTTFNVTVNPAPAKNVTSIEVTTEPTKTEYERNEEIVLTGLEITVNYDDESSEVISSGYTTNANSVDMTTSGEKTITVSYGGQSTSFSITVKVPTLQSITVTEPTKTTYKVGEHFNDAGLVVTGHYSDGSEEVIENGYEVSEPDMSTVGVKTITVTYNEEPAEFEITVEHAYSIIGKYGEYSWNHDDDLTKDGNSYTIEKHFVIGDEFKIRQDGKWHDVAGGADWSYANVDIENCTAYIVVNNDGNIKFAKSGTFLITFIPTENKITITLVGDYDSYTLNVVIDPNFTTYATANTYVYAFDKNNASNNRWYALDGNGQVSIDGQYNAFIVVRCNPAIDPLTANDPWTAKWNQTADISIVPSKTTITITGYGDGDRINDTYN